MISRFAPAAQPPYDRSVLTQTARRAAAEFADTVAYATESGLTITYSQLDEAADQAAAGLSDLGVGVRSVVALVMPSTIDYVVCYLALARLGATTAGLNPRFKPREIEACLDILDPDLVLASDGMAGLVVGDRPSFIVTIGHDPDTVAGSLRVAGASPAPPIEADDDRPVCICFTSGSTGAPKGAWFTNRQLRAIAELDTGGAWGGGGHGLSPTQFAHVGFMTKLPWLLAGGRTTHLLDRWSAGPVLELISRHRMPAVAGVAPQIALMLRHPSFDQLDFSCVKAIVVGGAASSPALVREARERFGAGYSIRYSSTESGGVGLGTALDADDEEALHTIGRPRPGVEAMVVDVTGSPTPDGEIGELAIRSPAVMSGYWNDPAGTSRTLVDGWLRTGDLAFVDADGRFRLAGRLKEMFIRGGYNVYPMEVESVLVEHPDIAEVALVPRSDEVMGESGVAVVVPMPGSAPPSLDELRAFGSTQLSHYKLPEHILVMESLPRNASDKIDRRSLADSVAASLS